MKKFILTFMLMFSMLTGVMAQTAIETPKFFDNVYVGVEAGATTPLTFVQPFKNINPVVGVVVGKDLTPVFGIQAEGMAWFQDHNFANSHTTVKAINVGVNGTVNFSNLFFGYKGAPRTFEVTGVAGLGWLRILSDHTLDGTYNVEDNDKLTAKTGVNFAFNFGAKKQHQLYLQPAVMWNLTPHRTWNDVQFDSRHAQFAVMLGYAYKFKTSNGTHNFKTYDVGAMNDEINNLRAELDKKPTEVIKEVEKVVEKTIVDIENVVYFAFDNAELDARAKETLDKLGQNGVYNVYGYASNEGSTEYNKALSQRRADAVAAYLRDRGAKVDVVEGRGVQFGPTTGRVAVVLAK